MKLTNETIFIIWYNIFQIHVLKNELQCVPVRLCYKLFHSLFIYFHFILLSTTTSKPNILIHVVSFMTEFETRQVYKDEDQPGKIS